MGCCNSRSNSKEYKDRMEAIERALFSLTEKSKSAREEAKAAREEAKAAREKNRVARD